MRSRNRDLRNGAGSPQAARSGAGALVTVGLLCIVVPLTVLFVGSFLAGWRLQHVTSGSMEPTYPVGSLLVSTPTDAAEVEAGMVITFIDPRDRGRTVTHRINEVRRGNGGELSFVTQGDANEQPDREEVPAANVQSRVKWAIPGLGSFLATAQGPWGVVALLGLPLLVIVTGEIRDRRQLRRGGPTYDAACTACEAAIGSDDRYCRCCGGRQARRGSATARRIVEQTLTDPPPTGVRRSRHGAPADARLRAKAGSFAR